MNQILSSYGFRYPIDLVRNKSQQTDNLIYKILNSIDKKLLSYKSKVELNSSIIESHSVQKTLIKGYVLVSQDSKYIKRASKVDENRSARLKFFDGEIDIVKKGN